MKIGGNFPGFNISAKGLSIQRKKMNLIAENIANADAVRSEDGKPYQRKYLDVKAAPNSFGSSLSASQSTLKLNTTETGHFAAQDPTRPVDNISGPDIKFEELQDKRSGEIVYMPDHPDANSEGYVEMSNVNIVTEMVDMIAASRSYEANLTAFNSSKQIAKDSLEI